ncbi:unnamed protein product [Victoria cruziana]
MGRTGALSLEDLAFILLRHVFPSRRAATPPYRFKHQSFPFGDTSPYASKSRRPIIVLKRCASSAQPSASFDISENFFTHFGGWANSDDRYGWEKLDAHKMLHDMGSSNFFRNCIFFINKNERRNIGLFFLGFMSALAVCRLKSSLSAVVPVCIFLFVSGFCTGYVYGDSVENVEFRNGKASVSQGSAEISFDRTGVLLSLLNESATKLLENTGKGKGRRDLVTDIEFDRDVQLIIKNSVHDRRVLGLAGGLSDKDYAEEAYSVQRPSRRSKELTVGVGVGVIHDLKAAFQSSFLGLKPLGDKSFPVYVSKHRDSLEVHESCEKKADGLAILRKMNPEVSTDGGVAKSEPYRMLELCPEGGSGSIYGRKQLISAPQESLDTIEMSQSAPQEVQDTREALCGNNSSSSLQSSETGTLQEYHSKDEPSKALYLNGNTLSTKKLVNQQESMVRASENQVHGSHWPNFGQNSDEDPISSYHEASASSQPIHDNKPKEFNFRTETKIAELDYELNCGENNFSSKEQWTIDNHGKLNNTLHSLSMIEDEKECLDEGVLLLSKAKERLMRNHDEEEAEGMLTRSANLLSRATNMNPTNLLAVGQWGSTFLLRGKLKLDASRELRSVLSSNDSWFAGKKYRAKAILDLSNVCEECESLLVEAGRKYRMALAIDGNDACALYNWGLALFFRAQLIADIGPWLQPSMVSATMHLNR